MPPHTSRPDSLFEMAYTDREPRQNRRGTLSFLSQLEMRPSSIAPNTVESRVAPDKSTVFLTSPMHREKLPEVTVTSRGNTGFPAKTRERPRDSPLMHLEADSPAMTREQCRPPPRNSNGDWTSQGPYQRLPEFPVVP